MTAPTRPAPPTGPTQALHARLRELRFRLRQRHVAYRQRHHAGGVWFRLRRVLAAAESAHAIDAADAERLIAEGHRAEGVGAELSPPKTLLFVSPERLARLASGQRIPVRLGVEFLTASAVALVPFDAR